MRVVRSVDPEPELVLALRRGESRALEQAYRLHGERVFGFLRRLCGDRQLALDLFQETWLKLARSAHTLTRDTDLRAWLFAVGRNAYFSHARKHARIVSLESADEPVSDESSLGDSVEVSFELERLDVALQRLSVLDREVLLLIGVESLSQERAAAVLGLEPATLRKRLSRARARLLALLEQSANAPREESAG